MVPAWMTLVHRRVRPALAAAQAGVPLPMMNRLPTGPANAAVHVMSQRMDQPTATAGDPARDHGPIMLLVPHVPAPLTPAADPLVMQ